MKRRNANEIMIKNPGRGLINRIPPNLNEKQVGQYWTIAKNVRCQDGATKNAPGYERVVEKGDLLDGPVNMIFNGNLSSPGQDRSRQDLTVLGTSGGLYVLDRTNQLNSCHPDNAGQPGYTTTSTTTSCEIFFAYVADSGYDRSERDIVVDIMEDYWPVDFIVHGGDMIYDNVANTWDQKRDIYEENLFKVYYPFVKGYKGNYGVGPTDRQRFYPAANNHEWTDWPRSNDTYPDRYKELFAVPDTVDANGDSMNKMGYTFKRGPVHFIVPDTYGPQTKASAGVGQLDLSSTGPVALWVKDQLENSDCVWKVVCMNYPPYTSNKSEGAAGGGSGPPYNGYSFLRWPFYTWGADVVLAADVHNFEHMIDSNGVQYFNCGCGGAPLNAKDGTLIQVDQPGLGVTSQNASGGYQSEFGLLRVRATQDLMQFAFHDGFGDPLYTYSITASTPGTVCYLGDKAAAPKALEVYPAAGGTMEVGQQWPLQALLFSVDNDYRDVTGLAAWTSSDTSKCIVNSSGVVTAVGVGSCTITATYEGFSTGVTMSTTPACSDKSKDYMLVIESSESMGANSGPGVTRMDRMKVALKAFLDSLDPESDRVGLCAYSGDFSTNTADYQQFVGLTNDYDLVKSAVDAISPSGDNDAWGGMQAGWEELSLNGRNGADLNLVMFCDTAPNVVSDGRGTFPTLAAAQAAALAATNTMATQVKDEGMCLYVILLDIYEEGTTQTAMENWASPGNVEVLYTGEDLYSTFIGLNNKLCGLGCDGSYYLVSSPCGSTPRLNYTSFTNWNVVQGEVDLIGVGNTGDALYDVYQNGGAHGQGLYIDMAGSGPYFYGSIRSKVSYTFESGKTYRLTWKDAGNWREQVEGYGYGVTLVRDGAGDALASDYREVDAWNQDFTERSLEVIGDGNSYFIQFAMGQDIPEHTTSFGVLIDEIELKNITDNTTLLSDNFDTETC